MSAAYVAGAYMSALHASCAARVRMPQLICVAGAFLWNRPASRPTMTISAGWAPRATAEHAKEGRIRPKNENEVQRLR